MPEDVAVTADYRNTPLDAPTAFAELTAVILAEHSTESIMQRVAEMATQVVPGADEASVTLVRGPKAMTVASTGELATALDERQYERGSGPCLAACDGNEVVGIPNLADEPRFAGWAQVAVDSGAASTLSVPVPVQSPVTAAINMYARKPAAFGDNDVRAMRTLASYAGVALVNIHNFESAQQQARQLEAAMASRAVIEQAKGLIMAKQRGTAEQAFDVLVAMSQHSNRKLRDVAQEVVAAAAAAAAAAGRDGAVS
jgi:GAF domain-containing protein